MPLQIYNNYLRNCYFHSLFWGWETLVTITVADGVTGAYVQHTSGGSICSIPNGCTFKNLDMRFGNVDYHGFHHAGPITMKNCTLSGKLFSYGDMTFDHCNFVQDNSDYHMWCYSGNVTYNNCTFTNNKTGKFLNIYRESGIHYTVTVNNCKFINNSGTANKAALNVKETSGSNLLDYEVIINGGTTQGAFPAASSSDALVVLNNLVQVDDRTTSTNITVTQDGVVVYPVPAVTVAQIADVKYETLQSAIDAAYSSMTGDVQIMLLDDITGYSIVRQKAGLNLTINGDNKTINGQIIIDGDNRADGTETLTIKNVKFEDDKTNFVSGTDAFILVPNLKETDKPYTRSANNYAHNITVVDCSFTSTTTEKFKVVGFKSTSGGGNCYNLMMQNVSGDNLHSFAQLQSSVNASFDNCTATQTGSFIGFNGGNGDYTISNCTFESDSEKTDGYAVREKSSSTVNLTLTGNNFKASESIVLGSNGTINVQSGTYLGKINKTAGNLYIWEGTTYSYFVDNYLDPEHAAGCIFDANTEDLSNITYTVRKGEYVALIEESGIKATTLEKALDIAEAGQTIKLLKDVSKGLVNNKLSPNIIRKSITIDGDNHTIANTWYYVFAIEGDGIVNIKNAILSAEKSRCLQVSYNNAFTGTLNVDNCTIISESAAFQIVNDGIKVNVNNSTIQRVTDTSDESVAFQISKNNIIITVTGCTISGYDDIFRCDTGGNRKNNEFHMSDSKIVDGTYVIRLRENPQSNKVYLDNVEIGAQYLATIEQPISSSIYNTIVVTGSTNVPASGVIIPDETQIEKIKLLMDETVANAYDGKFENYKVVTTDEQPGWTLAPKTYVAQIGDVKYETLADAVAAATEGQQIDILKDFELTTVTTSPNNKYNVNINKSVTINGNGYTITSSEGKRALVLTGEGNEITIKDLTIVNNKADWVLGITNNLTCTLDNTTIDANNFAGKYNQPLTIGSIAESGRVTLNVTNGSVIKTNDAGTAHYDIILWHPADITVTDSKLIGWANVYVKPDAAGSTINIEGSELKSQGLSGSSNSFAMITTESGQNTIVIKDTKITSSAVEGTYQSMFNINGQYNVLKVLGSTTYETNDTQWGAVTFNWFDQFNNNKVYFDETAKAAFEKYFDGSNCAVISDVKDQSVDLYPVNYSPEVMYYWPTADNNYSGTYCAFNQPFEEGWLVDGEFIELQKDITLTKNIIWQETAGSFNLHLGNYSITKGEYTLALNPEVTVLTDKQTDIFSSADAGYKVVETAAEEGADYKYAYSLEEIKSAPLLVFHDSGTYEEAINVMMVSRLTGATIKYQINDGSATTYSGPVAISSTSTLKAWLEVGDGQQIGDVITRTYTIVSPAAGPSVEGYYTIKNNGNSKNVNVAGRKTVTFVSDDAAETAAGTVIKVKATNGKVEVLRSQGVDLPGYANRAMKYVPEMVKLVVDKLHADGSGEILGENGLDAIMQKFNESFDYNLYMEGDASGYRLYGRTPSMKPVVDFYAENKSNVDAKLPQLEDFINSAIEKVKTKLNGRGASILKPFSVHTIWQNMGGTLIEPTDAATTTQFYEEVLASEANVWSFAYETAMYYYEPLMASPSFQELAGQIGDYSKYLDKLPQIRPNFKYYIVANGNKVDYISEGNENIVNDDASTKWTLNERTQFNVEFDETNKVVDASGTKYYTTLYTDFAYTMPENAKAYAVTSYNTKGIAELEEIDGVIPAQTPVLLMTQDEGLEVSVDLSTETGSAPTKNLLKGNDWVVNEYKLQTAQLHDMFELIKEKLGESFYNNYLAKYEHLLALNAGTVNNKYFFGLKAEYAEGVTNLRQLGLEENELGNMALGFWENYNALPANKAFLIEEQNPVLIPLWPDVNCDGIINVADVTALMEIVLDDDLYGPDWIYPYYNHSVCDINQDGIINVTDVTELISIVLDLE